MANVAGAALMVRLHEVLVDSRGTLRTVPSGRFAGDFPEGLSDDEQIRRAFVKPRVRADVRVLGHSRYSPPINGNLILYDIRVVVTSLRAVQRKQQLDEDLNDALVGAAVVDMDVIRQALTYPGNLAATQAAVATDLVSGLLQYESGDLGVVRAVNDGAQKLESKLTFTGWLKCAPAVA